MSELEEDIKHCEEVLANWHGCDECKADHERLLSYMKELLEYRNMRYFIISEEDLKDFIRTSKRFGFACESVLYCPSEEELEVTEENLKRFKELKEFKGLNEYSKEPEGSDTSPTIGDFLGDSDDTEGGYYDINEDFREIIEKLKKLDINISNLIQIYDNHRIEGKDYDLVYYTRLHIKKCIKNIESLSFLKGYKN